jgi:hypothetical protein
MKVKRDMNDLVKDFDSISSMVKDSIDRNRVMIDLTMININEKIEHMHKSMKLIESILTHIENHKMNTLFEALKTTKD